MPKIRGVKPELWTDENFIELSPYARLLWIGLWNYACDNGHVQDKSKQLKLRILPADDVNCADLIREIERQGMLDRAHGWITIPNLTHHQKPHKRWWTTCDKPGCVLPEGTSHAPDNRSNTVAPPKRNRGTTADGDCEGDGDGELIETPSRKRSESEHPERFDEFWDTYGNKKDRKRCVVAYRAALKKPGVTPDLLIASAAAYIAWQVSEGKHPQFTKHPTTWLNGECWKDERPIRPAPLTNTQQHLALVQQLGEQPIPFPQIGPSA